MIYFVVWIMFGIVGCFALAGLLEKMRWWEAILSVVILIALGPVVVGSILCRLVEKFEENKQSS